MVICRHRLPPEAAERIRTALLNRRGNDLVIEVPEGFELYQLVGGRWVSIDPYESLHTE